ncbi:MAG: nuclear transport factor 2 family protein [Thermoleophilaceae bacterium]
MTDDNIRLVQRVYELLSTRGVNVRAIEEMVDEGLAAPDGKIDFRGAYDDGELVQGLSEFARYLESQPWGRSLRFEPEGYEAIDEERVFVPIRLTGAGAASGVPVEVRGAHVVTIRAGRVVLVQSFRDREAARASLAETG